MPRKEQVDRRQFFGERIVACDGALLSRLPEEKREALLAVLREDPRPSYQDDPHRVYGFPFAGFEIKFSVQDGTLTVLDIVKN